MNKVIMFFFSDLLAFYLMLFEAHRNEQKQYKTNDRL